MASTETTAAPSVTLTVEFSGGLEMLFADQRSYSLTIPSVDKDGKASTIAFLIDHLCEHVMKDSRKELFVLDGHLRPGIEIKSGDNILFVSTLHGG